MDNVIKTGIYFGLGVAFAVGLISVRADDNPAQAAARVVLEQKLKELNNPATVVTPQTSSAATTPVAAPVAAAAPTKIQSATALTTPKPTQALAAAKSSSPPVMVSSTNEIVTTYGTIYENAQVEAVDADGIIVSYRPAGGGLAMSKVDFDELPPELQQRYEKR